MQRTTKGKICKISALVLDVSAAVPGRKFGLEAQNAGGKHEGGPGPPVPFPLGVARNGKGRKKDQPRQQDRSCRNGRPSHPAFAPAAFSSSSHTAPMPDVLARSLL